MCGRFCCSLNPDELRARLYKENVLKHKSAKWVDKEKHRASYNVCPARYIPTVYRSSEKDDEVEMKSMQWGFIPPWAKSVPPVKPINARFETLTESPNSVFNPSKNSRRCIIVAEGFFEWNKKKQTFYVTRKDGQMMLFAGLYSISHLHEQEDLTTCTIITTNASEFFSKIHNRMPVILDKKDIDKWLDKNQPWNRSVIDLLQPFKGELNCYQVTDKVGPTKNDYPELIVPIDRQKSSISQFLKPMDVKTEIKKELRTPTVKKEKEGKVDVEALENDSTLTTQTKLEAATKKRKHSSDDDNKDTARKKDHTTTKKVPKITNYFTKGTD